MLKHFRNMNLIVELSFEVYCVGYLQVDALGQRFVHDRG
ncbi:Methyl-accepting chemotaxis protein [Bacillus cereus AH676]|nr:Methyl-accepting chemotaxis protein [Bacillus cereus AH676]